MMFLPQNRHHGRFSSSSLGLLQQLLLLLTVVVSVVVVAVQAAAGTDKEGLAFLAKNGRNADVTTLESGLQYKVLTEGKGQYHPAKDSPCLCHYHGTLIDGTTFDSSYDRGEPTTFAPNQVIKGWTEAMQLMVEGDVWELTIPSELAYGDNGSPPKIPGGSVLVFKIEIIKIKHDVAFLVPASKCNVTTKDQCTEQDITYIDKIAQWTLEKLVQERERLEAMKTTKVKDELKAWIHRRIVLLREMNTSKSSTGTTTTTTTTTAAADDAAATEL